MTPVALRACHSLQPDNQNTYGMYRRQHQSRSVATSSKYRSRAVRALPPGRGTVVLSCLGTRLICVVGTAFQWKARSPRSIRSPVGDCVSQESVLFTEAPKSLSLAKLTMRLLICFPASDAPSTGDVRGETASAESAVYGTGVCQSELVQENRYCRSDWVSPLPTTATPCVHAWRHPPRRR